MATTPNNDQQPPKKGRKKPVPAAAPAEPFLTGSEPADELADPAAEPAAAEPSAEEIAAGARAFEQLFGRARNYSQPMFDREPRQDAEKNRAKIRAVMLQYIKHECRAPSVQEICEATGLSDKTVKAHKKHIKLGNGEANIYQALTHDVIMSMYKKAKGFTVQAEKLLTVSQGTGMGSQVERHELEVYHAPDTAAAKLWLQAIEGMSEKSETKHSGNVGGGSFHFEYVVPQAPAHE